MKKQTENKESLSLRFLYHTAPGRLFLKALTTRALSRAVGAFMSSSLSRPLIRRFVRKNNICLADYEKVKYRSFNDCFTRKILPELRPIPKEPHLLISPCDAFLSAYHIDENTVLSIKNSRYSIEGLLGGNSALAERYRGGDCLVFRLCVHHYHRYIYLDNGTKEENIFLSGRLHTVRPIALEAFPVFTQNCREYTTLHTEGFGDVTQIEVGALLVGKIQNHHGKHTFTRGEEKGMFLYGGSTIVLLLEKGSAQLPDAFFEKTQAGEETEVRMGEVLGEKKA